MSSPLLSGDPLRLGRYELTGRLGEGGQGVVYAGRGPDGALVAVKLLQAKMAGDARARERFVRELALAERVADFCTAKVLDADVDGDQPYIVSEFVEGLSLQELVGVEGPRGGADLQRLAIGTVTALAAIHQAGVMHRDFKPPNVLMAKDGPRVIDFGIARALEGISTMTSQVVGTPAYMAPEQIQGLEPGPWTDMFAWGATILFAATGRTPFGADTVPAVMHRILHVDADVSALEPPLAGLVTACLAKDPARRPTAPQALLTLLGLGAAEEAGGPEAILAAGATAVERGLPLQPPPTVPAADLQRGAPFVTPAVGMNAPPGHPHGGGPYGQVGAPPWAVPPARVPARARGLGVPWLAAVAVALGTFATAFNVTAVQRNLGQISLSTDLFAQDSTLLFWSFNAYTLALLAVVLPAGWLADRVGRKISFLVGLGLFVPSTVLAGMAQGGLMFLAGQTGRGAAAGIVLASGLGVLREMFPGRKLAWPLALVGAALTVATVAGPAFVYLFGAFQRLAYGDAWRWLFLTPAPLAVLVLVLALIGMREIRRQPPPARRLDLPAIALLSGTLTAGMLGIDGSTVYSWTHPLTVTALTAAALLGVGAVAVTRATGGDAAASPLLPASALTTAAATTLGVFGVAGFLAVFPYSVIPYSPFGNNLSTYCWPIAVGAVAVVAAVAAAAAASTPLVARLRGRGVLAIGAVLAGIADLLVARPWSGHFTYFVPRPMAAVLAAVAGVALTFITIGGATELLNRPAAGLSALSGGIQQASYLLGSALSAQVLGHLAANRIATRLKALNGSDLPAEFWTKLYQEGWQLPIIIAAAVALAGGALALISKSRAPADTSAPPTRS
ncbi:MFS transporter [Actinoallomurus sp. CA-150999]|uniref:MFS transporter n=1 Tax=Actinoallomurus sp. CA-150999 TaxID=3239887 RepID=UPI003D9006F6